MDALGSGFEHECSASQLIQSGMFLCAWCCSCNLPPDTNSVLAKHQSMWSFKRRSMSPFLIACTHRFIEFKHSFS